jgi:phosphoglycolate phosphatase-like HAD superfamily hydrolase
MSTYTREDLVGLKPAHATLVGIDSDGCVFDSMEVKQKQCFHGEIVRHWSLEPVEKELREAAEFVNLYSKWRGTNRFPALVRTFDLLRGRPEVRDAGIEVPRLDVLRRFVESGAALSNASLEAEAQRTGDPELQKVMAWSRDVNDVIARTVKNVPPFPGVIESLEKMREGSDLLVVSQTPEEALVREWDEHDLHRFVVAIAGQELGTKSEHLQLAVDGKYERNRVLMIGDAPGDLKAARAVDALFYPVNPGHEADSWQRLHREAYDRFLNGEFAGAYQDALLEEFDALLPEDPPWRTS